MHANESGVDDISRLVVGCVFADLDPLRTGFLENVYEHALAFTRATLSIQLPTGCIQDRKEYQLRMYADARRWRVLA